MGLNTDPSLLPLFWDGFFWAAGFLFSSFLFLGKKQKLLLIYRQVICMCFQVYGLSNIDLLRCVCVYVCCAALSPSFYFCLHCPSFVCSTPSLWVSNWLSSQYYFLSFCVSVWMCLFVLLAAAWVEKEGEREGRRREKERTTRQIQTNTTATSHSVIYFPTRHYNQIILGRP